MAPWIPETGDHVPEDKNKRIVQTPYGQGVVQRTRQHDGISEVTLSDWTTTTLQKGKPPTLYTPTLSLSSIPPTVGCDVLCLAGRGRVIAMMEDDDPPQTNQSKLTVLLSSWRLANRSRVKCYLRASEVQVVQSKRIYEMDVYEKIDHAFQLKDKATSLFHQTKYLEALEEYSRAVGTVKYVQHAKDNSPNYVRADLLVIMITCSNNAGTCSIKLGHHADRSVEFAKQALDLIHAMETKKGLKIHGELIKSGYSDTKLFGEWKVKACLILANGLTAKGNVDSALEVLKTARATIASFPDSNVLQRNEREVIKLTATLKDQRKAQIAIERRRAKAMFANTTTEDPKSTTTTTTRSKTEAVKKQQATRKPTQTTEQERRSDSTLDWFQNPLVLGSVGIAAGMAGTWLMYTQLLRKQRS